MGRIGLLVFGPSFVIGIIILMFRSYIESNGAYLFDYSMLKFFITVKNVGIWGLVGYCIVWLISPLFQVYDEINEGMKAFVSTRKFKEVELDEGGNVIAYRWFFEPDDTGTTLTSIGTGIVGYNQVTERGRGQYVNGKNISDRVPTLKNESGIYAAKTRNSPILAGYDGDMRVLAKVRLSGKIVEGEYGYRAQYCEVIKLYKRG